MTTTELPPPVKLSRLIMSVWVSQALHAASVLKIPDALGTATRASADVAREVGAPHDQVHRLLRALVVLEVATETDDGFALTPMGAYLRADAPDSMRNWAVLWGRPGIWSAWGRLTDSVRTGETAPQLIAGLGTFEWVAQDPEGAEIFNRSMQELTVRVSRAIAQAYDFTALRTVVDVGGGHGALLPAVLRAHPQLAGVVYDLPQCAEGAAAFLRDQGIADRCRFEAGDFFERVPPGADAYLVKSVLHDWDDGKARAILARCREAMRGDSVLLLIEILAPEKLTGAPFESMIVGSDLNMMLMTGGKERTEAQYRALAGSAGLSVTRVLGTPGAMSIVETRRN
ncbi:MAG: methyltransferase [Vicinamibacteria bacterium]